MAKDKKNKKSAKKDSSAKPETKPARVRKGTKRLKTLTSNPLVADVAAAALVAMAAALKDSKKARQLAGDAGDELKKLEKAGSERGNAMWELALEIGRRALTAINDETPKRTKKKAQRRKASATRSN